MASIPTPFTSSVGQVLTAAEMNSIRDAINFFLSPPRAQVRQTATQGLATSAWTSLTFDTEDIDTDGVHSTSTNTSRFTIVTPGTYLLTATVEVQANATGLRSFRLAKNGTGIEGRIDQPGSSTIGFGATISHLVACVAGDYLEAQCYQSSGGSLITTYASPDVGCSMGLLWVGT